MYLSGLCDEHPKKMTSAQIANPKSDVLWLHNHDEERAAEWFEKCWTDLRGNYMLAHGKIGCTNNKDGTEGNWGGMNKKLDNRDFAF
jgi:hypothetical protein